MGHETYPTIYCGGTVRSGLIDEAQDLSSPITTEWIARCETVTAQAIETLGEVAIAPFGTLEADGALESFEFFDVENRAMVLVWRVACRARRDAKGID